MSTDQIPADALGIDVPPEALYAALDVYTRQHTSATDPSGVKRLVENLVAAAAPILLAAGRKQAAADIRAARDRSETWQPIPGLRAATRREVDAYRVGGEAGLRIAEVLADPAEGGGHSA